MSESLPVEFTALAARHVRNAESWWRLNRPAAPNAVRLQLQRALVLIAGQPQIGSRVVNVKLPDVRRIFLPIIKQYLYYHVVESPDRVVVVALWHARRGSGPPI
jgi:plasmid stabilization system protein ParE